MRSKYYLPLGLVLLVWPQALAQVTTTLPPARNSSRAIAIFKRSAEAVEAIHSIRYVAKIRPEGLGKKFWPSAQGSATFVGWDSKLRRPSSFYVDIETRRSGAEQVVGITAGGNGDLYFVIDHRAKKAYEDMDPAVVGSYGQTLARFEMIEFVQENPFVDELNAPRVEFLGTERVNEEECYKVHVQYSVGRGDATWLISTRDFLPRQRLQHFTIPQGEGSLQITITELQIDPDVPPSLFKLHLPHGYDQIDDFAPE